MLAHSLLSRNKSDCQTDYKLRNFGNRNYLHAFTKIQLNSVGVKISKMKKLNNEMFKNVDLSSVKGGLSGGESSSATYYSNNYAPNPGGQSDWVSDSGKFQEYKGK